MTALVAATRRVVNIIRRYRRMVDALRHTAACPGCRAGEDAGGESA